MGWVKEVLAAKGSQVHFVPPQATVYEAVEKMVQQGVGSLMVMEGDTIAGIFTERDYLRRVALRDIRPQAVAVSDVMTTRVIYVDPERTLEDCMAIMTQERIRHLPVVVEGRLAGMISIGDLVKHLSREREVEIRYLTEYITGKPSG